MKESASFASSVENFQRFAICILFSVTRVLMAGNSETARRSIDVSHRGRRVATPSIVRELGRIVNLISVLWRAGVGNSRAS